MPQNVTEIFAKSVLEGNNIMTGSNSYHVVLYSGRIFTLNFVLYCTYHCDVIDKISFMLIYLKMPSLQLSRQ